MTNEEKLKVLKQGIREKRFVKICADTYSKGEIKRKAVPFDYGPIQSGKRAGEISFNFFDVDSPSGPHTFSPTPENLLEIELLDETFDPADYITWDTNWHIARDWGEYS